MSDQERIAELEAENAKLRAMLSTIADRLDEMPNPHANPMRHFYNNVQVYKADIRKLAEGGDDE